MGAHLSRALLWGPGPPCSQALTAGPPGDSLWAGVSACGVGGRLEKVPLVHTHWAPRHLPNLDSLLQETTWSPGCQDAPGTEPPSSSHRPGLSPTELVQLRPLQARPGLRCQPSPSENARGWTTAPCWPLGWTFSCLCIRTMASDAPRPRPPPETQLKQETQTQLAETLAGSHMAAPTQLFFR